MIMSKRTISIITAIVFSIILTSTAFAGKGNDNNPMDNGNAWWKEECNNTIEDLENENDDLKAEVDRLRAELEQMRELQAIAATESNEVVQAEPRKFAVYKMAIT